MLHTLRRIANRVRYRHFDAEMAKEIEYHRTMKAQELADASPEAADPDSVRRAMGNELRMRETAREVWIAPGLEALGQDVRDACRLITRRPFLSVAAIAALVIGVGAATIACSLLNALVFRPLPVARPGELVYLADPSFSFPIVQELRARSRSFANAFAWNLAQFDADWSGEAEPTLVLLASGSMSATLEVRPVIGRLLTPADEGANAAAASTAGVIGYRTWQRRFGGDPAVLGRIVTVQGVRITIVGVTPPGFFGVAPGRTPELTVPVTLAERLRPADGDVLSQPGRAWLHFMGRLRPDVSKAQADAELMVTWPQVLQATIGTRPGSPERQRYLSRRTALVPGATGFSSVRNQFRQPLLILAGLTVLLLVVGCATVAHLLLAGAWGRSRELAVRVALGCGRARLARQLFIEGFMLSVVAAAFTVLIARWSADALVAFLATSQDPVVLDLAIDWRVAGFVIALVCISAIVFSAPAMVMAARLDPGPSLKAGSRQVAAQGHVAGRVLVTCQIAVSVVLLVGAGLFLRSLMRVLNVDPGFDSAQLVIARLDPLATGMSLPEDEPGRASVMHAFQSAALAAITATPEVQSVALSLYPPVSDRDGSWTQSVGIDGAPAADLGVRTFFNAVSPRYFETVRTRLVAGRGFSAADTGGSEHVVIVNESMVRRLFAGQNPIGREISVGLAPARRNLRIVGVAADSKYQRLQEETRDIAYLPCAQTPECLNGTPVVAEIRVGRWSDRTRVALAAALAGVTPPLAPRFDLMSERIRESLVTERLLAMLGAVLAGSALFLATCGLFGLMAHVVARRTREIGVRLALGARPSAVLARVLAEAVSLGAFGLLVGTATAAAAARWIGGVLYDVTPRDPMAYAAAIVTTLVLVSVAGVIPARRAASVDPIEALRAE
jgi:putative ABC transport system permease protein